MRRQLNGANCCTSTSRFTYCNCCCCIADSVGRKHQEQDQNGSRRRLHGGVWIRLKRGNTKKKMENQFSYQRVCWSCGFWKRLMTAWSSPYAQTDVDDPLKALNGLHVEYLQERFVVFIFPSDFFFISFLRSFNMPSKILPAYLFDARYATATTTTSTTT